MPPVCTASSHLRLTVGRSQACQHGVIGRGALLPHGPAGGADPWGTRPHEARQGKPIRTLLLRGLAGAADPADSLS
jgi:hypothetical protein